MFLKLCFGVFLSVLLYSTIMLVALKTLTAKYFISQGFLKKENRTATK
jgi:hypothetical protein